MASQTPALHPNCQAHRATQHVPSLLEPSRSFYPPTVTMVGAYFFPPFLGRGWILGENGCHSRGIKQAEKRYARNDYQGP